MNLRKTKLYKTVVSGSPDAVMKSLWEYLKSGKDVNLRDEETSGTLLHLLVEYGERFCEPDTIQAIYMMVCKDIEIDALDNKGETALHKVMRKKGTYRIMMAIIRCGADTRILNLDGKTAEDVLLQEKPEGWQEMQHWYNKYKPGLWAALDQSNPDRHVVERLLKNWCRLTCVKNGNIVSIKSLVRDDIHKRDLLEMIERYENPNEMALALSAGFGFIVKGWVKADAELLKSVDVNTRDFSYQYAYPEYPETPRPLLASAWESNNFDAVDVLMNMKPDTRVLWTYEGSSKNPPKPVFFQLLCGNTVPKDEKVVMRVLQGSDLSARDYDGNTILHTAVIYDASENIFKNLMSLGADIAARDSKGRTPRDVAVKLNKSVYVVAIDEFIVKLVKDKKFNEVEKLILHNYDHLSDITDSSKRTIVDIAKRSSSRQIYEVINLTTAIHAYIKRIFTAVDDGLIDDAKKLLSCKKYSNVRDKCGRTLLHRCIMKERTEMLMYLLEVCSLHINIGDNLDRTPLHYAYLFMPQKDVIEKLVKAGAMKDRHDPKGRKAADYALDAIGTQTHSALKKDVRDFDLNIYLAERDFDETVKDAIKKGDLKSVKCLISGVQSYNTDLSRFSYLLFDCIDNKDTDIAKYLIGIGFKSEIWKEYTKCDPNDDMCAMMECGHGPTSLKERAMEMKCEDFVSFLERRQMNGTVKSEIQNGDVNILSCGY